MAWLSVIVAAIVAVLYYKHSESIFPSNGGRADGSIFNFTVDQVDDGNPVSLSKYSGKKAYLVVNVASQCGLTDRNYAELQQVYEKYSSQGLEILAFPCNNFGGQEPAENLNILSFAREVKQATFPVLGKLECDNGEKTHPLYNFLKSSVSGGLLGSGLKWNFAKFLCDKDGVPVKRYLPISNPLSIEKDIVDLLESQK
eukprot:gene720-769_t